MGGGERAHPILAFPDLDEAIALYQALGFRRTYRQLWPNPYAVVDLEDITGFSGVDVGGNRLRVYRAGDPEADSTDRAEGLARVVEVAARQGDARAADAVALEILDRGLARHADAPPIDRARALLYRAELLTRLRRGDEAVAALAAAEAGLTEEDASSLVEELAHARDVVAAGG